MDVVSGNSSCTSSEFSLSSFIETVPNEGYVIWTASNNDVFDEDAALRGEDETIFFASGKRVSIIMKPSPKTSTNAIARL
jgi:hypothetical protein